VLFYRLGLTGREWTIPSDWLAQLSIFWPLLWVLGLLGCLPLYVCWRRQPAE